MRNVCGAVAVGIAFAVGGGGAAGQQQEEHWAPTSDSRIVPGRRTAERPPALLAIRVVDEELHIDGRAVEDPWTRAHVAADFVQFEPREGAPATERTEARVLYGDHALYVAIRAYESEPHAIVGQLTRRDQMSYSDRVGVVVDSYFDRRTAFQFTVNPVGVKQDVYHFDDTSEDAGWDAVWDVATTRDAEGWTAEFRIPYSQLRFRDADVQTWGINFLREIARREETDVWAPIKREDAAIVSRFGELQGLEDLQARRRLEMLPYSVVRLQRAPGEAGDPFHRENETAGTVGADVKYGLTSDLTLDLTLNPDFGQVEADPAQVNLTAFETFYPERRPFFVEGAGIFNFRLSPGDGDDANESLFYSRRIGRAPQGDPDDRGGFVDVAPQTTILGAAKLSGKTAGGWSIGALQAVTSEESARIAPASGPHLEEAVEPYTSYSLLRVQRDFREGRSAVGAIGTFVRRDGAVADALEIRRAGYTGGVDFRHRFADDRYQVSGYVLGSYVTGSAEAITRTQRSAAHYYQRPDAEHLDYDPTRTSLAGASAFLDFGKIGGEHWRWAAGVRTRTPGFEVNDIGYQRDADEVMSFFWVGYQQSTPQGPFRRYNVNLNGWGGWNYAGDRAGLGGNVNVNFQLANFWNAYLGVNRNLGGYSDNVLRGGPLFLREGNVNFWGGLGSDSRKAISLNVNTWGNVRRESDSWNVGVSPNLRFRPSGAATFTFGPTLGRNVDDYQWIGRYGSKDRQYVFGRIDQTTVGLTARVDYAFSPTLSLQLYAQPFVSAATYGEFKRVVAPRAAAYADRFQVLASRVEGGDVLVDADGDGVPESFDDPEFNFKQFRSNTVLRWEFKPGSALFLVWSQGRNESGDDGAFDFGGDVRDLFGVHPDNVFMVKLSYWLSR